MSQQPNFHTDLDIDTPYTLAQKEWDTRIGDSRVQAKNWRISSLMGHALNLLLAAGLIYFAGKVKIIPYVIEVAASGQVRAVGRVDNVAYAPREESLKYYLNEWVGYVRSISNDPVVVRRNWERAYAFTTDRAATTLSAYAREVDPFSRIGKFTVTIEISQTLSMSERGFEVEWVETIHSSQGMPIDTTRYTGFFNVIIRIPDDEEVLQVNPLGIFIDTFTWAAKRV